MLKSLKNLTLPEMMVYLRPRASHPYINQFRRSIFSTSRPGVRRDDKEADIDRTHVELHGSAETRTGNSSEADGDGDKSEGGIKKWLADKGPQFKEAHKPRNWIGKIIEDGETLSIPFPLNTTFRPPTPISDALRSKLYDLYMADPEANSIRQLAQRHHISLKRMDAILRLKGLEMHWKKVKSYTCDRDSPLMCSNCSLVRFIGGFQAGMEFLLGVTEEQDPRSSDAVAEGVEPEKTTRYDVDGADALDQDESKQLARQRYQRMFWEAVPEGTEPTMLRVLEKHQQELDDRHQGFRGLKYSPSVMPHYSGNPPEVNLVKREGRPSIKFIDVGGKFVDVKDRLIRNKEGERRRRIRQKKAEKAEIEKKISTR